MMPPAGTHLPYFVPHVELDEIVFVLRFSCGRRPIPSDQLSTDIKAVTCEKCVELATRSEKAGDTKTLE